MTGQADDGQEEPPTRIAELAERLVEVTEGERDETAVVDTATALRDELETDTDALVETLDGAVAVQGPQVDRGLSEQLTTFSTDAFGASMGRQPLRLICEALLGDYTRFEHEFIVEQAATVTAFERDLAESRPEIDDRIREARAAYTNNEGGDFVDREAGAPTNRPVRLELFNVGKPTTHFVQGDVRLFEYQLSAAGGALRRPVTVAVTLEEVSGFDGGLVTEREVRRVVDGGESGSDDEGDRIGPDDTSPSVTVDGGLDPLEPVTVYLLIEATAAETATVELQASVDDATEARLRASEVLSLSAVTEAYEQARVAAIEEYKRSNDDDDSDGDGSDGGSDTGPTTDDENSEGGTELWPFGAGALGAAGGYAGYRYLSGNGSDSGDASDGPTDEE